MAEGHFLLIYNPGVNDQRKFELPVCNNAACWFCFRYINFIDHVGMNRQRIKNRSNNKSDRFLHWIGNFLKIFKEISFRLFYSNFDFLKSNHKKVTVNNPFWHVDSLVWRFRIHNSTLIVSLSETTITMCQLITNLDGGVISIATMCSTIAALYTTIFKFTRETNAIMRLTSYGLGKPVFSE